MQSKNIFCDIDHTLCWTPFIDGKNIYEQSMPWKGKINVINALYKAGHQITIYTARGATSDSIRKQYLYDLTIKQLITWGLLYHKLDMSKPSFDILIDDKALTSISASQVVEMLLVKI